ncbi:unnamed protein product [Periconia digitata]|uniref:Uncharacterized protein n=1 Tax=Periconia digitata TaxID=1303443 RepID=A0A9W4U6Z4_9PLEO|nr:unnamed protein product [Periconia digitata]
MRISRAPQLRIASDAPWVITPDLQSEPESTSEPSSGTDKGKPHVAISLLADPSLKRSVIYSLKKGFNTEGKVIMDRNMPYSASKDAFYVIISREGVRKGRTLLRLFSKLVSVTAYIMSTALFASSTLLHLQPAILVMALVLCAAIFGRVTAMWISSVIMRDRPVLHRIVKTEKEADVFVEAILRKEGIVCEVLGHVVINGRCVKRSGRFSWSTIIGILAKPIDVGRISMMSSA